MVFLDATEVREKAAAIRFALTSLLANRSVVARPQTAQWKFFLACAEALLSGQPATEYSLLSNVTLAQYKFEAEDKLRRFYQRPGKPVDFVFTMVHLRDLLKYQITAAESYPNVRSYCVLVRDLKGEEGSLEDPANLKPYLERVVTEAIDAEFRAYTALPAVDTESLQGWFCPNGPAYREVLNLLTRHKKKGWILSNPLNPSTKRLLSVKVRRISGDSAEIGTMEYWYLRWWDDRKGSYTYSYRETNRQTYILRKTASGWCVFENLRPSPRTSAPNRRVRQ